jgi:hypothetical protein
MISHLIEHLPERKIPERRIEFPRLKGKPGKEHIRGPVEKVTARY